MLLMQMTASDRRQTSCQTVQISHHQVRLSVLLRQAVQLVTYDLFLSNIFRPIYVSSYFIVGAESTFPSRPVDDA